MRVVLADDHSIIRAALLHVIHDIDAQASVTEACSFDELETVLATFDGAPPDLVVLDLNMPGFKGREQVRRTVEAVSPHPVVVFSMMEDPAEMRAVLNEGIRAFIPKSTQHGVLGGIMRIVLAGGTYVPPQLGMADVGGSTPAAGGDSALPTPLRSLTTRQRQVMELLGEGLSNNDICGRLGLNLSTVKAHVSGVLRALGAESRTQAALRIRELLGKG
ncbi:MAG: regulator [Rhodospirillaceae bacterium BRH_c57]|nr:MAG: regulator [Rhodospirillaceae bacterium BRH_c57]